MPIPRVAVVRSTARSSVPASELITRVIDAPLPPQFRDWLALTGVAGVEDQVGSWRTVGQRRVLRMTDGSQISERLVDFDAGSGWTNELSGFTNSVRHMLSKVVDDWRFTEDEEGTVVTWTWTFHPRPTAVGRLLTHAAIAPLHRPYLQRILEQDVDRAAADRAAAAVEAR